MLKQSEFTRTLGSFDNTSHQLQVLDVQRRRCLEIKRPGLQVSSSFRYFSSTVQVDSFVACHQSLIPTTFIPKHVTMVSWSRTSNLLSLYSHNYFVDEISIYLTNASTNAINDVGTEIKSGWHHEATRCSMAVGEQPTKDPIDEHSHERHTCLSRYTHNN